MRVALTAGCLILVLVAPGGCKKKAATPATTPPTMAPAAAPPSGGNSGYVAGAGVLHNVRQASKRTVALNDLHSLGLMIELGYTDTGKMPGVNEIKAALGPESKTLKAAIDDGSIILCWTTSHEGLWAYEIDADTKGGLALVSGNARRCNADEIKQLLGRK